jgi:hypothetical protein
MFFAGAVIVWLVSLTVHYLEISNLKRKLSECESKLIKSDKSQEETEVKEKQN